MPTATQPFMQIHAVSEQLLAKGLKIVTAESCTGGGLAYFLTSLPGSSAWFERGFVTYSNESKMELLFIDPEHLAQLGAVSATVAKEMAEGALQHGLADISIAITGIAGPDGASQDKPVGLVWFGIASRYSISHTEKMIFTGDRTAIRLAAITHALEMLLQFMAKSLNH